jgi:hypothetical protein
LKEEQSSNLQAKYLPSHFFEKVCVTLVSITNTRANVKAIKNSGAVDTLIFMSSISLPIIALFDLNKLEHFS